MRRRIQQGGLADLEKAYKAHRASEERLRREILFATDAGSSLRAIATIVDMSPETVRTIVHEETAKRDRAIARLAEPPAHLSSGELERALAARRRLAREWRLPVQEADT
jgi:lambda repressor-like predicted transcriptional regulator